MTTTDFGYRLKYAREWQGYSLRQLAEKANVDHTHIWRLEKDQKRPTISSMIKLAMGLGVTTDYLCGLTTINHMHCNCK